MPRDSRAGRAQDSLVEALRAETVAGTENLGAWLNHVAERGGADALFRLETWLRGLRAFFRIEHLPLDPAERAGLLDRSFAPEIHVVRRALKICERSLIEVAALGQPERLEFDSFIEAQLRRHSVLDYHVGRVLEQSTPLDSLGSLLEGLGDTRALVDALDSNVCGFRTFLGLGRSYSRALKEARYVDMLLGQRFKLQYDRIESPALAGALRGIAEEPIRQGIALALLYCYRFLRALRLVAADLVADRPLRSYPLVFALLHEEFPSLVELLRTRFLKGRDPGARIRSAVELVIYSIMAESERTLEVGLFGLSQDAEAPSVQARVETAHGLLLNAIRGGILTLLEACDANFDGPAVFSELDRRAEEARRHYGELWELSRTVKAVLDRRAALDVDALIMRVGELRASSLAYLLYRDWPEFERSADAIITTGDPAEARTALRQFVAATEGLLAEISSRSASKIKAVDFVEAATSAVAPPPA